MSVFWFPGGLAALGAAGVRYLEERGRFIVHELQQAGVDHRQ